MSEMTDLIWIGNTLLPRWFVFSTAILLPLVFVGAAQIACWAFSRWSGDGKPRA